MAHYDAVVVGGGHNGLIAAAYLGRSGVHTLVLERRNIVGGACVTEDITGAPGYRVSTGAAQLSNLRPEIIRDLNLAAHGFELLTPDPITVFPFPDGRHLALWSDPDRTRAEFVKFSHRDAGALPGYMADCAAVCETIESMLYAESVPSVDDVERAFANIGRRDLFQDFVLGSIADVLEDRFESEAVQAVLGYTATFGTNAGPRTPGTAYVMAHHMFGGATGVRGRAGYVKGGMSGLANALAAAAMENGVEIRTDAEVARILVRNGIAYGVELMTGERIAAKAVISNADPQRTFLNLVDREKLSPGFADGINRIQMQGVALKVNCALTRLPTFTAVPDGATLARVSLCPSLSYVEAAWAEAAKGFLSSAPYMTVHMQSAIDDALGLPDRQSLTCYAQFFPYNLAPDLGGWNEQRAAAGRIVLEAVAAYAPDIWDCVLATEVMSPMDMERRFGMTGGHQFHGDLMPGQLFDRRPAPGCDGARTPIDHLYLCGAGAHPGGCVWGAPGKRAAQAVRDDIGSP